MSRSADSEMQPFEQKRFQDVALRKSSCGELPPLPPTNPPFPAAGDARGLRAHGWLPLARPHRYAGRNRSAENTAERTTALPRFRKGDLPHFPSVPKGYFAGRWGREGVFGNSGQCRARCVPRIGSGLGDAGELRHLSTAPCGAGARPGAGGSLEVRRGGAGGDGGRLCSIPGPIPDGAGPAPPPRACAGQRQRSGRWRPPPQRGSGSGQGDVARVRRRGEDTRIRGERRRREGRGVLGMCGFLGEVGRKSGGRGMKNGEEESPGRRRRSVNIHGTPGWEPGAGAAQPPVPRYTHPPTTASRARCREVPPGREPSLCRPHKERPRPAPSSHREPETAGLRSLLRNRAQNPLVPTTPIASCPPPPTPRKSHRAFKTPRRRPRSALCLETAPGRRPSLEEPLSPLSSHPRTGQEG